LKAGGQIGKAKKETKIKHQSTFDSNQKVTDDGSWVIMSDEDWHAMADDPEDYDELVLALKTGKLVPKD
jgi:hypothetical protein|tara:strand:+ start:167 stop:373 length:207 start_codon:yes stop_codon:yes gene_type:complete